MSSQLAFNTESRILDLQAIRDIGVGATFLGAGGGGETYATELQLQQALEDGLQVRMISVSELRDEALVAPCGWMGAPAVQQEKFPNGSEALQGIAKLEEIKQQSVAAVLAIEIGGQNGLSPMLLAAQKGIPVLDCDGMGRAFPQAHMVTFNIYGCSASPVIVTDEHRNCIVLETENNYTEEKVARHIAVAMGGMCHVVDYPLTGYQVKQYAVRGTVSLAEGIGRAIRLAREKHGDPFAALFSYLRSTGYYKHPFCLFDGKVVDVKQNIEDGFCKGTFVLEGLGMSEGQEGSPETFQVDFQNENLVARRNGNVVGMVPDIITLMDRETAQPINTENVRYGMRVNVIATSVPPILRRPEALAIVGPGAFGIEEPYTPLEQLNG